MFRPCEMRKKNINPSTDIVIVFLIKGHQFEHLTTSAMAVTKRGRLDLI